MRIRNLSFVSIILVLFASLSLSAKEVNKTNPYLLIKDVSDSMFTYIKANKVKIEKNPDLLRAIAEKDILPYINVRYAALKVLGPFARQTTKEQRDAFTKAFSDYLTVSYAQILTQYTDQNVDVEEPKSIASNRNIVSVRVNIVSTDRAPIRLDFKLRKNKRTEEWQGFDVQVEGVSMLDAQTSEWQGDLRKHGVDYVTRQLIAKSKAPIKKEERKS